MSLSLPRLLAALPLLLAISTAPSLAQEETPQATSGVPGEEKAQEATSGLTLELNKLEPSDTGCLFTFVTGSEIESDIEKFSYEVALFDGEGLVERMTVLDFQDLPAGSTRVRQFNLPETDCDDISRVLINDAATCEGAGIEPGICMSELALSSQSDVTFSN